MNGQVSPNPEPRVIDYLCVWWNADGKLCYCDATMEDWKREWPDVFVFRGMFKTCCVYPLDPLNQLRAVTGIDAEAAANAYYVKLRPA